MKNKRPTKSRSRSKGKTGHKGLRDGASSAGGKRASRDRNDRPGGRAAAGRTDGTAPASVGARVKPVRPREPSPVEKKKVEVLRGGLWLYGRHAVAAALGNPQRKIRRLLASRNAADWLSKSGVSGAALAMLEDAAPEMLDELLQDGAVHQGLAALAEP